jgi:hypothetical protein
MSDFHFMVLILVIFIVGNQITSAMNDKDKK